MKWMLVVLVGGMTPVNTDLVFDKFADCLAAEEQMRKHYTDAFEAWDRWAAAVGLKNLRPAQIVRIDSMSSAMRAAEKKIGIALLPAELSRRKFAQGRLVRVFDEELVTQENYTLLVRTEDENRDDIRALCAWLVDSCRAAEEN
jgi:DNA-binding transcriptional LysR family regulator